MMIKNKPKHISDIIHPSNLQFYYNTYKRMNQIEIIGNPLEWTVENIFLIKRKMKKMWEQNKIRITEIILESNKEILAYSLLKDKHPKKRIMPLIFYVLHLYLMQGILLADRIKNWFWNISMIKDYWTIRMPVTKLLKEQIEPTLRKFAVIF